MCEAFLVFLQRRKSQGRKKELYHGMTDKLCSPKGDYRSDDEPRQCSSEEKKFHGLDQGRAAKKFS